MRRAEAAHRKAEALDLEEDTMPAVKPGIVSDPTGLLSEAREQAA